MAMHDKMLNFFFNEAVAGGDDATSAVIDNRFNGDNLDNKLFVFAQLGLAVTNGSFTVTLQTSADGSTWTDVKAWTNVGAKVCAEPLPTGLNRYIRLTAENDDTNDTTVFAELTDTVDVGYDKVRIQADTAVDVAKLGDQVTL